jgi:sugar phosphate isomerase/epimerase
MIVALHGAPKGFFMTGSPHSNDELLRLVRKTASLGFKGVEVGPLADYGLIDGRRLKELLDGLGMMRSVHVGGLFDALKFASSEEEYLRVERQLRGGVTLSSEVGSAVVSVHPPFFSVGHKPCELYSTARKRFLKLLSDGADFACHNGVRLALESFCYWPFIFDGLDDFVGFVSNFSSERLGVLLEVGHLYQAGISLSEAVHVFGDRLADVHVHDATLEKDYREATHLPIGRGTVDFRSLIKLLRDVGYDGWLTLEIRGTEEEIEESRKRLEDLLAAT